MVKTILSDGNSRLIALMCSSERDLGNLSRCFYDEFRTSDRCSYAAQYRAPRLQMSFELTEKVPIPRPCRIHAVNGGLPLPKGLPPTDPHRNYPDNGNACLLPNRERRSGPRDIYYYDFAVIGECGNVDVCLRDFLYQMGLREVEKHSSYMSTDELHSLLERWEKGGVTSYSVQNSRELGHLSDNLF